MKTFTTLLKTDLAAWTTKRGIALATLAALLPLALAGAWLGTHQADVAAAEISFDDGIVQGDETTIIGVIRNDGERAVPAAYATLTVGSLSTGPDGAAFVSASGQNRTELPALAPGEQAELRLDWTARAGVFWVVLDSDSDDAIGELDEFNNQRVRQLAVQYRPPSGSDQPAVQDSWAGNGTTAVDLAVTALTVPSNLVPGDGVTIRATFENRGSNAVANATATIRLGTLANGELFGPDERIEQLSLQPGEAQTVELAWVAQQGVRWVQASVAPPPSAFDSFAANNQRNQSVVVQPVVDETASPPDPPARLTIKEFYITVLAQLQLRVVVPFIAMAFTVGVLADPRREGDLVYMLTRPVPRWMIPLSRFLVGGLLASLAVVIGVILAFVLLFQLPGGDIGFLTTPFIGSLLALLAYGAFFVFLGTLVERPYLWGVVFVLGWETIVPFMVPGVGNLTISIQLANALQHWPLDEGVLLLPHAEGRNAVWRVLGLAAVFLLAAAATMKRREVPVE